MLLRHRLPLRLRVGPPDARAVLVEPHPDIPDGVVQEAWTSDPSTPATVHSRPVRQPLPAADDPRWRLALRLRRGARDLARAGGHAGPRRRPAPRRAPARRPPALAAGRAATASPTRCRRWPGSCSATTPPGGARVQAVCDWIHEQRRLRRAQRRHHDDRHRDPRAARRHVPRLRPPRRHVLPGARTSRPATCSATCPTSASPARTRRWTSTPGSRCGWASAGGRSTRASTRRASAACRSARGRDAVDVAMVTTYGAAG